jgi:hypothetical protein
MDEVLSGMAEAVPLYMRRTEEMASSGMPDTLNSTSSKVASPSEGTPISETML